MIYVKTGEVRKIGVTVSSASGETFTVDGADYAITERSGEQVDSGYPTIDGHRVLTLFSAARAGVYQCEFTLRIGPEILKHTITIEVR